MDKDLEKDLHRFVILNNLAYLMADVANTYCMEAISGFDRFNRVLQHEEKVKFKRMMEAARKLKLATKDMTKAFYQVDTVDNAVADSDYFANLILLIVDRVHEDDGSQQMLVDLIKKSFVSKEHLFREPVNEEMLVGG